MKKHILIELTKMTSQIDFISGLEIDKNFGVIDVPNREITGSNILLRAVATDDSAIRKIEKMVEFRSIWVDTRVVHSPPGDNASAPSVEGNISENSEKGEYELFLLSQENWGKPINLYKKWLYKINDGDKLPKPLFEKMKKDLGTGWFLVKTEEINKILERIQDKSRIKGL